VSGHVGSYYLVRTASEPSPIRYGFLSQTDDSQSSASSLLHDCAPMSAVLGALSNNCIHYLSAPENDACLAKAHHKTRTGNVQYGRRLRSRYNVIMLCGYPRYNVGTGM